MNMSDVKTKAKGLGIDPGKMKKPDLICAIQTAEGYAACYGKSNGECPYSNCCFRQDCLKVEVKVGV